MKPNFTYCPLCGKPCTKDEEHEEIKNGKFWKYIHLDCWLFTERKGEDKFCGMMSGKR